ncbi:MULTISPECIES: hypothetical protein [Streptococcus]
MPDVILLAKIFYRKDSLQKVKKEVMVPCETLLYRLVEIFQAVCEYY